MIHIGKISALKQWVSKRNSRDIRDQHPIQGPSRLRVEGTMTQGDDRVFEGVSCKPCNYIPCSFDCKIDHLPRQGKEARLTFFCISLLFGKQNKIPERHGT